MMVEAPKSDLLPPTLSGLSRYETCTPQFLKYTPLFRCRRYHPETVEIRESHVNHRPPPRAA